MSARPSKPCGATERAVTGHGSRRFAAVRRGTEPAQGRAVQQRRLSSFSLLGAWLLFAGGVHAQVPPSGETLDLPTPETSVPPGEPAITVADAPVEATPEPAPEVTPAAAPVADASGVTFTLDPGRGMTLRAGDDFSLTLLSRIQMRNTVAIGDDDADPDGNPEVSNELQIRTLRLWLRGHILDPDVRYGIQLAFGSGDFETLRTTSRGATDATSSTTNPSPIFDAYVDLTELRDLSVRIGQFFVPFDRARTIREFALQSVDRAEVIRELTLDRDVGVTFYSNDLFGLGGILGYQLGIFGGDGRNRFGARDPGFLYVARAMVRPMGTFDDDQEGDLLHTAEPRLLVGAGFAFNHQTDRRRSTTGDPYDTYASALNVSLDGGAAQPLPSVTFDQVHAEADLVLKWRGLYVLGEVLYRQATTPSHTIAFDRETGTPPMTTTVTGTVYARDAWGWLAQASYATSTLLDLFQLEVWGRYEQTVTIGATDPDLIATVNARGHGVAGGLNFYFHGHMLKAQLDWSHSFGDDFGRGPHVVRLQLDVSF